MKTPSITICLAALAVTANTAAAAWSHAEATAAVPVPENPPISSVIPTPLSASATSTSPLCLSTVTCATTTPGVTSDCFTEVPCPTSTAAKKVSA
ncbi:uncharacterized protein SCHCODRAFT_02617530 [Schizophyllum commune H4-8]|uniref:uncharacterized protein n=1 Tax=Schizophyllum commune (strain H4-8 / FGSC 9210) TaxID=578458 RepID=UPI00215EC0DD|nr:uncharacterized protein SCHCODRAFT_02617530 [Schizophyllum commune H4-8]KAI5894667.1 hypothetical protein SCHCODRAFT_02617530 [Schizophyllum commune H4-8]